MGRIKVRIIVLMIAIGFLALSPFEILVYAQDCDKWVAKVVSVQGAVEVCRSRDTQWAPVKLNDTFCPGDMIRVHEMSRAAVILYNESIVRLDQKTSVTFSGVEEDRVSIVDIIKGAAQFFSRVPRSLKITTPFVNGAVEGTEFYVEVRQDQTLISVFQGRVLAANDVGSLSLSNNQTAITKAGMAPEAYVVARPRDAVRWAIYYPAVVDYRFDEFTFEVEWQAKVRESLRHFRGGDRLNAFSSLEGVSDPVNDPRFYTYRAGLLLIVGRVDEAGMDIERAISIDPKDSRAASLKAIIAVAQNRKDEALSLAKGAVDNDPNSAAARIALSYALQADFRLEEALESVKEATTIAPENALAWARLSELWMSVGDLDKALEAAQKAELINPNLAHTQTVLGFAYLAQINTTDSIAAFEKAIILDQAAPLPRLGLGLAKIREGDLEQGRREIEIAASLDPDNSLIRSYLGKAFFDEKDDLHADRQLTVAKELDPNDPTPWFYDAIRKQTINRPVEALQDLQKSIELNDNRAVYRSRLQLDEDLAARSAGLARIYNDLGFEQLALVEGWKSVNTDPSNYSSHRFLADSYAALPRHEVARVSELLQSQLLQPININPVQPHLAESNSYIYEGAGPADPSFNEFNPLFNRNRLALQASGIVGDNDTLGDETVHSGVWNKVSYSVGQFHYETDGFRKNNDQEQDIFNVFLQTSLSPKTSIQGEFRYKNLDSGDLSIRFFPDDIAPNQRGEKQFRSERFGFHHAFAPNSEIIGSFIRGSQEDGVLDRPNFTIPFPPFGFAEIREVGIYSDIDGSISEIQHLLSLDHWHFVTGAGYYYAEEDVTMSTTIQVIAPPLVIPAITTEHDKLHHTNLYLYTFLNCPRNVTWTIGASGDFYNDKRTLDQKQFNPKFGFSWNMFPSTTVRACAFRALRRTLFFDQTIEPTQVAGFNQFFDDGRAADTKRWGIGIDQKIAPWVSVGAEFSMRDLDVISISYTTGEIEERDWRESLGRAYLYLTPHQMLSLFAEYQYEWFDWDPFGGAENATEIKTHRLPFGINFFHPSGITMMLKTTYVYQEGDFGNIYYGIVSDDDRFLVVDSALKYRLPKRYGFLSLEVKNLFNEEFHFQDTDSRNPHIFPERYVFARFSFAF